MTTQEAPSRNRLLGVLFIGVLMAALDIAIVGPALPAIRSAGPTIATVSYTHLTLPTICSV